MPPSRPLILVVDDEPINIEVMAVALDSEFEVICAGSGPEALKLARETEPDLVFLDVVMPGMDGYEVCARLKADPSTSNIPVIFVTALEGLEDEERGLRMGAIDYVNKPIRPPLLRARARNHVELKRARDQLANRAQIDALTGLANRHAFDNMFRRECQRHHRNGAPLSLVLVDIDHFKTFHEHYGSVLGDDCLRQVAAILHDANSRPADMAARIGSEAFACMLPETPNPGAAAVAERIRQSVENLGVPHGASLTASVITVSLGLVTARDNDLADPTLVLSRADRTLYEAKTHGGNRVCTNFIPE